VTVPLGDSRPNLVVIVLDCARASSFPETGGPEGSFPSLEALKAESTVFTRAATVAPWTLPSHASLFTGRYPWEHGVMGAGRLHLDESVPTVEGRLRQAGYATLALSANGLLGPLVGRPGSFETYRCAEWWEKTVRWVSPESLGPRLADRPLGTRTLLSVLMRGLPPRNPRLSPEQFLTRREADLSLRKAVRAADPREAFLGPWGEAASWGVIDLLNRIARVLSRPWDSHPLPVTPWIEPTLAAWLERQPAERPVHCFLNLLDLHEKYLSDAEIVPGIRAWLRFARLPQYNRLWLQGKWRPTPDDLALLRRIYEAILAGLDRRLGSLIELLRRAGRWDNTLLVITSDHGQAFGEHGHVFHEQSPFEPLLHVPLWIRWPHGEGGSRRWSEPTSLVDVAPTLLRAAGIPVPSDLPGISLQGDPNPSRPVPVLAMADGYPSVEIYSAALPAPVADRIRRVRAIAYAGDFKAIVETGSGLTSVFDLRRDPEEQTDLGERAEGPAGEAIRSARSVAEQIRRASDGITDTTLHDRLRSWGYL